MPLMQSASAGADELFQQACQTRQARCVGRSAYRAAAPRPEASGGGAQGGSGSTPDVCSREAGPRRRTQQAGGGDQQRLSRIYDAIKGGVASLDDPDLKDRISNLKATRDQAKADAERATALLSSSGKQAITPDMIRRFADRARQRLRLSDGRYRRDHSSSSRSGSNFTTAMSESSARRPISIGRSWQSAM